MEIGNFIIFAILLMAIAIIVYSLFFAEKDKSVPKKKPLTMPTGFADRYWEPIVFEQLEKNIKPGSKGRNEGSNNSPVTSAQKLYITIFIDEV